MVGNFHSIGFVASQMSWKSFPFWKTTSSLGVRRGADATKSAATANNNKKIINNKESFNVVVSIGDLIAK